LLCVLVCFTCLTTSKLGGCCVWNHIPLWYFKIIKQYLVLMSVWTENIIAEFHQRNLSGCVKIWKIWQRITFFAAPCRTEWDRKHILNSQLLFLFSIKSRITESVRKILTIQRRRPSATDCNLAAPEVVRCMMPPYCYPYFAALLISVRGGSSLPIPLATPL